MNYFFAGERVLTREGEITRAGGHLQAHKVIRHRLLSYYYHGFKEPGNKPTAEALESAGMGWTMFLDSGAFTAWTKKKHIPVEMYAQFVHNSNGIWHIVSNLDDIAQRSDNPHESKRMAAESAEKSYQNQKALERLGVTPCPVFHAGEPWEYLQRYLDEGYQYIFLGGLVGATRQVLRDWLDKCWGGVPHDGWGGLCNPDGTAKVKIHGFGITDMQLTRRYPWHSVDSSSWLMAGVYGGCMFWNDEPGREVIKVDFSDQSPTQKDRDSWHYKRLTDAERAKLDRWLAPIGVTADECARHYSYRDTVNAFFYSELEKRGTDRFDPKEIQLFE